MTAFQVFKIKLCVGLSFNKKVRYGYDMYVNIKVAVVTVYKFTFFGGSRSATLVMDRINWGSWGFPPK